MLDEATKIAIEKAVPSAGVLAEAGISLMAAQVVRERVINEIVRPDRDIVAFRGVTGFQVGRNAETMSEWARVSWIGGTKDGALVEFHSISRYPLAGAA
jgi:hypothetical protein